MERLAFYDGMLHKIVQAAEMQVSSLFFGGFSRNLVRFKDSIRDSFI